MVKLISDGAVLQQNGESIDVGQYDSLKACYTAAIVAAFLTE